jgi:hypothetical protein
MNFCDDLGTLCQELDEVRTEESFRNVLNALNGIVKDVPVDFIKAVLLALIRLAGVPARDVTAIMEGNTMRIKFAIADK